MFCGASSFTFVSGRLPGGGEVSLRARARAVPVRLDAPGGFDSLHHCLGLALSSHNSLNMCDDIKIYCAAVTGSVEIRKQQSHMKDVLDGKKVKYEEIDISSSSEDRDKMRELCGDPKALPPQIFRGNKYLGDYQAFANAVEDEKIEEFLSK